MTRVVLDTNVVVSALLRPDGVPAEVLNLAFRGSVEMCVSDAVYAEYKEVVTRPAFGFQAHVAAQALVSICRLATWVRLTSPVRACVDPDDDIFVECAVAAGAQYIVTGNLQYFPPRFGAVEIVNARSLLERVRHLS